MFCFQKLGDKLGGLRHVSGAVLAYMAYNVAVWLAIGAGGLLALAGANALGGLLTVAYFWRSQIQGKGRPRFGVALLGAIGVSFIVLGLRASHNLLPLSLSMEAVYNGFATLTWPLFIGLGLLAPKWFQDKPTKFDLACHLVMASLVALRFGTYGELSLSWKSFVAVAVAIAGYALFNVSIKLAAGHRATNVAMNLLAALLLIGLALITGDIGHWSWDATHLGGLILGGLAIFALVRELGASYGWYVPRGLASLVAPLVYDGVLVATPLVMFVTGERVSPWTIVVAAGMLAVTWMRYHYATAQR